MDLGDSKPSGPHATLARLVGDWHGPTTTWFEPNVIAGESPMTGKISSVLEGRFLLHEYKGELQGKPFSGLAIYGFDLATQQWQSAWVDSFHMSTGMLFSLGDESDRFTATGSYFTGNGSPRWRWRTEIEQIDDDNIVITAYNISPEGDEAKATETRYTRRG